MLMLDYAKKIKAWIYRPISRPT